MGPLAGIKILELAGIGPGPCAGMMLADMGARVTLIERKGPNKNAAATLENVTDKNTLFNRGKKSIALDLKNPAATELVLKLVADADILIEGFRPGVMERLGLGPEVCLQRNPKLVYGRMTGWGQTGPLAQVAGHDPNYIGLSGALWYGGASDRAPRAPLGLVGDLGGGTMVLLFGLLSAYIHAQKTGEGQVVDSAITDGSAYISTLSWMLYNTGQLQDELGKGWADWGSPWHDTYECADGKFITLCAVEPQFYQVLMQTLGLGDNPVFADQWDTSAWPRGKAELQVMFRQRSRQAWCELLEGTDACFAPVLNFAEAPRHPHNIARETFLEIDGVVQPAPAPRFSRSTPSVGKPPRTGEHTEEILRTLGLPSDVIGTLRKSGVI